MSLHETVITPGIVGILSQTIGTYSKWSSTSGIHGCGLSGDKWGGWCKQHRPRLRLAPGETMESIQNKRERREGGAGGEREEEGGSCRRAPSPAGLTSLPGAPGARPGLPPGPQGPGRGWGPAPFRRARGSGARRRTPQNPKKSLACPKKSPPASAAPPNTSPTSSAAPPTKSPAHDIAPPTKSPAPSSRCWIEKCC